MTKTSIGGADSQEYAYVAGAMRNVGRTAATFTASMNNFVRAVENAKNTIHSILEAYYFDREAEARWDDDGGPCRD